jgi:hypothetical protein
MVVLLMKSKYRVPHVNKKAPPLIMEDVPLGDDDVLLHIRSDEPYMLIQKDGTWPHVIACVLAYVMQRQDIFDICLQAWMREAMNQPDRWEMFKAVLRERIALSAQNKKSTLTKGL